MTQGREGRVSLLRSLVKTYFTRRIRQKETRPIAMAFLIITVISCTLTVRKNMQDKKRAEAAGEEFDTAEEEG